MGHYNKYFDLPTPVQLAQSYLERVAAMDVAAGVEQVGGHQRNVIAAMVVKLDDQGMITADVEYDTAKPDPEVVSKLLHFIFENRLNEIIIENFTSNFRSMDHQIFCEEVMSRIEKIDTQPLVSPTNFNRFNGYASGGGNHRE